MSSAIGHKRRADADARTAAIQARVDELERLLIDRGRGLRARARGAEEAFNSGGPLAFVDVIHAALASSVYPKGCTAGARARFTRSPGSC